MFVAIHHTITDPQKWDALATKIGETVEQGKLPKGLKALFYFPSMDGRQADCVWEVDSMDNLRKFIDPQTTAAAKNEYFQINTEHAFGLPEFKHEQMAA